jgi:glutamyl-tRNA synthetase/glutamyl-Q tRNA(Asp) synthetase
VSEAAGPAGRFAPGERVGRFAPSTTGPAHPGTLLAALLCWLDARAAGGRVVLRLEDLDPVRCTPERAVALERDLAWLGLDWDAVERQSDVGERHAAGLDRLQALGVLYPCSCSRSAVHRIGQPAPDGGVRYPGTCRGRRLPEGGWRASDEPLRVRLEPGFVDVADESGMALGRDPERDFGDPVVRRRDGAVAYHLAGVLDDAALGVTRVVRGRDLAVSTATQVALQRLLGLPRPAYRHHLLLLEEHGEKLAKFHGAVGAPALRAHYTGAALCGWLAHACGLRPEPSTAAPRDLLPDFAWTRVAAEDRPVRWTGSELRLL